MALAATSVLMLAAAMTTPQAAARAIFAPYATADTSPASGKASWERSIYTRETAALIRQWQKAAPRDEIDDLNDGDWLCQCQDWDSRAFRLVIEPAPPPRGDRAQLRVTLAISADEHRTERLLLRREDGRWLLDDLFADSFPRGLKRALRETTLKDRRQRR